MPRIRVLPDHVANQIAAGEVVERPASVVKELVENAIDAKAQRVEINIERGGKARIRVSDDGVGMIREDALLCLDRHATSKIREATDLKEILTLGFRGEALPSIAAVSRLTIETQATGGEGTRIRSLAGRIQGIEDVARRPGTTIDVQNLFLNTPARARFLGTVGVETRAISEVVHALALANLDVHFTLHVNGRQVLDLPGGRTLTDRIATIWNDPVVASLIPVSTQRGDLILTGALQRPDNARPGFRRAQLFVNGRPYRDAGVLAAADRGYRTTVPEGSRAWLFLYLQTPPDRVDINVHPGKAEVRFAARKVMEAFVESSVRETLEGEEAAAVMHEAVRPARVREGDGGGSEHERDDVALRSESSPAYGSDNLRTAHSSPDQNDAEGPSQEENQISLFREEPSDLPAAPGHEEAFFPTVPKPHLLQIHNAYILAETRDGMIIVDQHAAHERVLFERIMAQFSAGQGEGQRLLFPMTIRLTRQELDVVASVTGLLSQLGFEIEPFGSDAVLVQAVPSPHRYFDAEKCVREMIGELAHGSDLMNAARNQNERVAMSFACKGAIKAGQRLSSEEMQELFDQLFATELPYHDVHGRPTIVRLGLKELERKFGRT